jgi:hypothetical protein
MNKIPFIIVALILTCLAIFSVFGFLASSELKAAAALPWKIGYAALSTGCIIGVVTSLKKVIRTNS